MDVELNGVINIVGITPLNVSAKGNNTWNIDLSLEIAVDLRNELTRLIHTAENKDLL